MVNGFASDVVGRLPRWLAPGDEDRPSRRTWRVETIVLIVVGVLLAVSALNDIVWSVNNNGRLVADQMTWRHYNHRDYFNVSAAPLVVGQPQDPRAPTPRPARRGSARSSAS